jgi:hypothetical protein
VLRDSPEWTRERIDAAMQGTRPTQVNLKEKLTVFLLYDTAYVDSKGVVSFADDYYGHDAQLEKALRQGYPYPRKMRRRSLITTRLSLTAATCRAGGPARTRRARS